jgi:hypothetical protein
MQAISAGTSRNADPNAPVLAVRVSVLRGVRDKLVTRL